MNWLMLFWSLFFLADLGWLWKKRHSFRSIGIVLWLVGSSGILLCLAASYISSLPSHAPQRTVTGLATSRSTSSFLNRHHWDFMLIEEYSRRRFLFHTAIDGPWTDQPARITYLDDGSSIPSVVRIEILSEDQVPWWHVEKGHAGWVGTAEAKRSAALLSFIGFLLILLKILTQYKSNQNSKSTEVRSATT
jgi:hypothetical protein